MRPRARVPVGSRRITVTNHPGGNAHTLIATIERAFR
jgi:hypothetical protein